MKFFYAIILFRQSFGNRSYSRNLNNVKINIRIKKKQESTKFNQKILLNSSFKKSLIQKQKFLNHKIKN